MLHIECVVQGAKQNSKIQLINIFFFFMSWNLSQCGLFCMYLINLYFLLQCQCHVQKWIVNGKNDVFLDNIFISRTFVEFSMDWRIEIYNVTYWTRSGSQTEFPYDDWKADYVSLYLEFCPMVVPCLCFFN